MTVTCNAVLANYHGVTRREPASESDSEQSPAFNLKLFHAGGLGPEPVFPSLHNIRVILVLLVRPGESRYVAAWSESLMTSGRAGLAIILTSQ